jgi:hypothetical protein
MDKFLMSISPGLFCFIGCVSVSQFSAMGIKKNTAHKDITFLRKNHVDKTNPDFLSAFFPRALFAFAQAVLGER